ncbi:MAG: exodeoxyribonuclease VII small subunit [SAR202 cluster bacterium]|nr:exodeoxyribonuclease VII small subunit [SAR202 cluster bacterium]
MPESTNGQVTFESALAELDQVVTALEAGALPLSEATRLYERGMKLARICNEMLVAAELRITQIQTAYGEQMRLPPQETEA